MALHKLFCPKSKRLVQLGQIQMTYIRYCNAFYALALGTCHNADLFRFVSASLRKKGPPVEASAVEAAMKRHEASLEASWRFIAIYSCLFRAWTSISALLCTCQR